MKPYSKLEHAICEPNYEKVVRLAKKKGCNLRETDSHCRTLLHWASMHGNPAIVNFLLQQGVSHAARTDYDFTALHFANCAETTSLLIDAGADIWATNGDTNKKRWKSIGNTPVHTATWYEKLDVLDVLLERGADINCRNREGTAPIHEAAAFHCVDFLESIIKRGADVDQLDGNGRSPLHHAVENNNELHICALISAGATIPPDVQAEVDAICLPNDGTEPRDEREPE
ncbi:MAG: ankyrin repeat domain-containing protein [Pirellulaceae bacterium]